MIGGKDMRRKGIAAAGMLLVLLAAGCANLDPYRIGERSIAKYLRSEVGPADRYRVHIDRDGSRIRSGYISHMTVTAEGLESKGGIRIRRLDADLFGVRFDPKAKTLQGVERSAFIATVTEAAANEFLLRHDRGIPGLSARFEPDVLVMKAAPEILGVTIPVTLRGRCEVQPENRIRLLTDEVAISKLNVPMAAVRYVEQRLDPVFDANEFRLPASVESITIRDGEIDLRGTVKLPVS
jgi:hypothetical protein